MGFATRADVPVVLVGDIDRGGVIASLAGTHLILPDEDRAMIAGYLINKFRGDVSLFDDGLTAIERFTGWRCFGVVPWLKAAARLPAEDSVVLERLAAGAARALKVAVPMLSRIANFDDLDPLKAEPQVEVVFVRAGRAAARRRRAGRHSRLEIDHRRPAATSARTAGTATSPSTGGAAAMSSASAAATRCSAASCAIPTASRAASREAEGLGLLDVETVMEPEKTVRNVTARSLHFDVPLTATRSISAAPPVPDCLRPVGGDQRRRGRRHVGRRQGVRHLSARPVLRRMPFAAAYLESLGIRGGGIDYRAEVERALDELAAHLETHLDCDAIFAAAR